MLQKAVLDALADANNHAATATDDGANERVGWHFLGDIGNAAYLDGVHRLCRLAARASDALPCQSGRSRTVWTLLRVTERAMVMAKVGRWLSNWPKEWVSWAGVSDLTQHYLEKEYGPWPGWVKPAIAQLPYSHGPVNVRRPRQKRCLSRLRKEHKSLAVYRQARAALLLTKAGLQSA
ncbi:hypothetical protein SUTH_00475 [Sulfuritalea hydrogenivorans sk43H]|uniref:Uncharacterized protein n=2 Tax=Sulfuritalea hydrogenivorans TaxID=748811 RepID=W0SAQ0_9PROT|nr:hypothetical protein SUTH_00475 [Sulfuritalea hydrogenivorans sk43H]